MNHDINRFFRFQAGYTLIELLTVLVIVGVLVTMATPFLTSIVQNNRLTSQINLLLGTLQLARTEAIKRGSTITVCSSSDSMTCGSSWQDGWIIKYGSTVIKTYPALAGKNTLRYNISTGATSTSHSFNSRGFSVNDTAGTWTLCDSRGTPYAHGILISSTGRVLKSRDTNNNSLLENVNWVDLSCP